MHRHLDANPVEHQISLEIHSCQVTMANIRINTHLIDKETRHAQEDTITMVDAYQFIIQSDVSARPPCRSILMPLKMYHPQSGHGVFLVTRCLGTSGNLGTMYGPERHHVIAGHERRHLLQLA